jgi:hypothetical protein
MYISCGTVTVSASSYNTALSVHPILSPTAEGGVLHRLWLNSENFRFKFNEEQVGLESEIFRLEVKLQEVPLEGAKDTEVTAEVSFAPSESTLQRSPLGTPPSAVGLRVSTPHRHLPAVTSTFMLGQSGQISN